MDIICITCKEQHHDHIDYHWKREHFWSIICRHARFIITIILVSIRKWLTSFWTSFVCMHESSSWPYWLWIWSLLYYYAWKQNPTFSKCTQNNQTKVCSKREIHLISERVFSCLHGNSETGKSCLKCVGMDLKSPFLCFLFLCVFFLHQAEAKAEASNWFNFWGGKTETRERERERESGREKYDNKKYIMWRSVQR